MARVRSRDTKPELRVRQALHGKGYRYRLFRRDLPGTPDLVFPGRQCVIFVHGCFWHGHKNCKKATIPKTRHMFWKAKILANQTRDQAVLKKLQAAGWRTLVAWECETRDMDRLTKRLTEFLESGN
jgi:DNA mismatch endonuclease, patch repair protein